MVTPPTAEKPTRNTGPVADEGFYVAFADMLGFADMVMAGIPTKSRRKTSQHKANELLEYRLDLFHRNLDDLVESLSAGDIRGDGCHVISFSDSCFVANKSASLCIRVLTQFVMKCTMQRVPVRVGIGYGTFVTGEFSFKSDMRTRIMSSRFLGSGVIHAVQAEKSLKGIRIAVHPSVMQAVAGDTYASRSLTLRELPAHETSAYSTHEISYIAFAKNVDELISSITAMYEELPDNSTHKIHYVRTLEAFSRVLGYEVDLEDSVEVARWLRRLVGY